MPLLIDYDSHWKEVISEFFEDFTAFFLPEMHKKIDFTKPVEFLEQELLDIFKTKYKGKRINDKLVKVYLKDGTEKWLLVHIEVQGAFEKDFAERMFLYYTLIYAKYEIKEITAIAIFTHSTIPKVYNHFTHTVFGTTISYKFNAYKVIEQSEEELLKNENPFALVVLANLYVLYTSKNFEERLVQKEKLFEIANNRGFDEKKLIRLLIFVRNLMILPEDLEFEFQSYITKDYQNTKKMLTYNKGDRQFAETIYKAVFGISPTEFIKEAIKTELKKQKEQMQTKMKAQKRLLAEQKKLVAAEQKKLRAIELKWQKAEEDRLKAEEDKLKAESDKLKAEEDRLKAEEDKLKAQEDKLRMEEKQTRAIIKFYEKNGFEGFAQFCELLELDYVYAEEVVLMYLSEQNQSAE